MGLFDKFFDTLEGDTLFRTEVEFLLDVGIKILSADPEGGWVKIWLSSNDATMRIVLFETTLLRDAKMLGQSPEEILHSHYGIEQVSLKKFLQMTKVSVEPGEDEDFVSFDYTCSQRISKSDCKNWLVELVGQKYPSFHLKYDGAYVLSFTV